MPTPSPDKPLDWLTISLSVIGTLVTLIVGFGVYWLTKRGARKKLSYSFSAVQIDQFATSFSGDLKISFRSQPVENVSLVSISFVNSGSIPIQSTDFEQEIIISVPPRSRIRDSKLVGSLYQATQLGQPAILAVQRSSSFPSELPVKVSITGDSRASSVITIQKLLLNSRDNFKLTALIRDFDDRLRVTGRIVGVERIIREAESEPLPMMLRILAFLIFLLGAIILAGGIHPQWHQAIRHKFDSFPPWVDIGIGAGTIFLAASMARGNRR